MVVRVRIGFARRKSSRNKNRRLARTLSDWATPASVAACLFALWRLSADLNWIGGFAFSKGLLSHWQVWLAVAVLLQIFGSMLNRYGRGDDEAIP